ncbi:hypothetical protein BO70DRAFT_352593 [Aspergillus heteromorphus CBS 117.55]|uniref:Zincin n=1 Tax=Aspergillus heteromorphus CBS 117.55 TaxID=1448321 RepID=A0A317W8Q9_9EURO|nr:uncharacterized protein BO70DRAFT_352593 [Aspergillus heteromorphus CBS 117.55]PWY82994.1 hypothetical protein BO70DRAFT_352593 [Aspergillus heteromorphus CBS 117.55]
MASLPLWIWVAMLLSMLLPNVHAGHPTWETARFSTPDWISIRPWEADTHLWPDAILPFCFDSDANFEKYRPRIESAFDLWYAAGLPNKLRFRYPTQEACEEYPYVTILVRDTPSMMTATTGVSVPTVGDDGYIPAAGPPTMYVSVEEQDTWEDNIRKIAHLIGHLFGLHHEHQTPSFWNPNTRDSRQFDFWCEYLADFEKKTKQLTYEERWGTVGICQDRTAAILSGFSAANFLPLEANTYFTDAQWWSTPDWNSIMIYSSYVGGAPDRQVLQKANGGIINTNYVPSAKDVAGLKFLYTTGIYENPLSPFFNNPLSPYYGTFRMYNGCNE